jgi:hypothetical protein
VLGEASPLLLTGMLVLYLACARRFFGARHSSLRVAQPVHLLSGSSSVRRGRPRC